MPNTPRRTVGLRRRYFEACHKARLTTVPKRVTALGIPRSVLIRIESGAQAPTPAFMAAVLDYFAEAGDGHAWERFFRVVTPRRPTRTEESE